MLEQWRRWKRRRGWCSRLVLPPLLPAHRARASAVERDLGIDADDAKAGVQERYYEPSRSHSAAVKADESSD